MSKRTIKLMKFGRVLDGVSGIRVVKDSEWGEFQVQLLKEDGRSAYAERTYFTDDKQDAIETAQYIWNDYILNQWHGYQNEVCIEVEDGHSFTLPRKVASQLLLHCKNNHSVMHWNQLNPDFRVSVRQASALMALYEREGMDCLLYAKNAEGKYCKTNHATK